MPNDLIASAITIGKTVAELFSNIKSIDISIIEEDDE